MDVLVRNNVTVLGPAEPPDPRPMMFSHGFGCDQNMWRLVTPAFEDRHRIVLFDHVGAGASDLSAYDPRRYDGLRAYAEDVLEILGALDLREVVFVGHSVSAMIGVLAANAEPERFSGLVPVGPSPRYIDDEGYVGGFSPEDIEQLLGSLESNYLGWSAQMAPVIMGRPDRPELGEELTNSFCRTDPDIAAQFARVTFLSDNRGRPRPRAGPGARAAERGRRDRAAGRGRVRPPPDPAEPHGGARGDRTLSEPERPRGDHRGDRGVPLRGDVPDAGDDLLEESAEDLFEYAPCGYLSSAPDGTILKVNETFLRWTGYARDDLVTTRRLVDLLAPGDRIYYETHLAPLLRMQGSVREIAVEFTGTGGERLPALLNADLRLDPQGRPAVVRATVFDATDRRSYERELLSARERERAARERVERLQRLTAALAQSVGADGVADVLLDEVAAEREVEAAAVALGPPGEAATVASRPGAAEPPGARSGRAVEVPLTADDRAFGVLRLWLASPDEPTGEQQAFFEACAVQAAQAIERSQLQALTRVAARRAAFLARAGGVLEHARGLDERARRLLDLVVGEVAEGALLHLRSPRAEAVLVEAADPALRAALREFVDSPPGDPREAAIARAMEAGEPQTVPSGRHGRPLVALGLRAQGRALGVLVLARGAEPGWADDLGFLRELAGRVALSLESALLYDEEHEVATTLQHSLLPKPPPSDPRGVLAARYLPAVETLEVGGDWYDAFAVGDDAIALVVGDVVGRGLQAATTMGRLQSAARALLLAGLGPAEALTHLDAFAASVPAAELATIVVATVDLEDGATRVASAGHPPPAVFGAGGPPELVWSGRGAPLGCVAPGDQRAHVPLTLPPGAGLLLYTDGLVERRHRTYDEGFAQLLAQLPAEPASGLPTLVDRITRALLGREDAEDDVCVLAFGRAAGRA